MYTVPDYDDRPHVDAYRAALAAGDVDAARDAAGRIVETHLGFLRQYARQSYFGHLTAEQREEYLHELVLVALERVPDYDPDRGSFPTYVKPYLQTVRWRVAADRRPVRVSTYTQRMIALAEQTIDEFRVTSGRSPSPDELADLLTEASGRRVGPEQAARLAQGPSSEELGEHVEYLPAPDVDPADVVFELLAALSPSPLGQAILEQLASPPAGWRDLDAAKVAVRFDVPVEVVQMAAEALLAQIRDELA